MQTIDTSPRLKNENISFKMKKLFYITNQNINKKTIFVSTPQ